MATAAANMKDTSGNCRPPVDSYIPSMWGDIFSSFSLDDQLQEMYAKTIEDLKKEVKIMLMAATSDKLIILIDTLERLGLAYHFEAEIEEKLEEIYNFHSNLGDEDEDYSDLFVVALRFRLLRQHQYHVSCSMFEKFADKEKKFREILSNDVEGLLSLYEAGHVQVHGEDILEEGLAFAVVHLTRMLPQLESPLQDKVKRALEMPLHKGMPILHARHYIPIYARADTRDEMLLKFAGLNFNFLQNLYKTELCQLLRWWNKFELESKLPFVRDRVPEFYFWSMAFRFEPQYSEVRLAVAKCMQMQTIMDDTYDNYATLEEAKLFTEALERWDVNETNGLSDYLKVSHQFIMRIYEDFEREAAEKETSFAVPYFKETVKQFGMAYNQELKWLTENKIPSFEDYLANSIITSGANVIFAAIILSMKSVSKETIDWLRSEPQIVVSTAKMARLLNDLASHERESKGGEMITLVDCRTKFHGLSKQETLSKLVKQVDDGWKDLNKEWVLARTCGVPKDIVEQVLNFSRGSQVIYSNDDGITYPEKVLAPHIVDLFVDPLVI